MATDAAAMPVNGNYSSHQSFGAADASSAPQASAGASVNGATGSQVSSTPAGNGTSGTAEGNGGVPKDEVGWYFVEQYYTTLSRSPEKLHVWFRLSVDQSDDINMLIFAQLFYNKRSQFVSGVEAEKVSVSVGQRVSLIRSGEIASDFWY